MLSHFWCYYFLRAVHPAKLSILKLLLWIFAFLFKFVFLGDQLVLILWKNTAWKHTTQKIYNMKNTTLKLWFISFFFRYTFRLVFSFADWAILLCSAFCVLLILATLYFISSSDFNEITPFFSLNISVLICWFTLLFNFPLPSDQIIYLLCYLFCLSQVYSGSKPIYFSSSVWFNFVSSYFCRL